VPGPIGDECEVVATVESGTDDRWCHVAGHRVGASLGVAALGEPDGREHRPRKPRARTCGGDVDADQVGGIVGSRDAPGFPAARRCGAAAGERRDADRDHDHERDSGGHLQMAPPVHPAPCISAAAGAGNPC
jgi:hypothetical protein